MLYLNQERKTVFTYGHHSDLSKCTALNYIYQLCHWWHVSVFQSNLHDYVWSLFGRFNYLCGKIEVLKLMM